MDAGSAGGRGARCALQPFSPASSGVCEEAAGRGGLDPAGARGCRAAPGHADCLRPGLGGKVAPGAVPARQRCASFPKRRHDRALLRSYPFSLIPPEHS